MLRSGTSAKRGRGAGLDARASERGYETRMALLEAQMEQLIAERYGRATDREHYEELRTRAQTIGGDLTREFGFDEAGQIIRAGSGSSRVTYRRPYWLARKADDPAAETVVCNLPRQFAKLEQTLAHDEQAYRACVQTLAYAKEPPALQLMEQSDFEARLKALAREAGGSLELKTWSGKTYAYYYRYKRLKTATVFSSLLTHSPYHTSGKHRYAFWLPVDYVLLRQLLEADAKIYAALPAGMKRPGYP